jgi:hypothetical protein
MPRRHLICLILIIVIVVVVIVQLEASFLTRLVSRVAVKAPQISVALCCVR